MDRRLTPFSGRVALRNLQGVIAAEAFTDGEPAQVRAPLVDLLARPDGPRDRQVLMGDAVTVIDRQEHFCFVQTVKDGYCGWVGSSCLMAPTPLTHWISARSSHLYSGPKVQAKEMNELPFGAQVQVLGIENGFAELPDGYIPMPHLSALHDRPGDPVMVAESLIGAPYLWGGNSAAGLDCSGLVQGAYLACGLPCPADSDLQQVIGSPVPEGVTLRRGDLIFWKGHVAIVVDATRLIHANGHSMTVAYEEITACVARIAAQGGGDVTARRRP